MSNPSFDINQWYSEHDLDYRTPELIYDSRSASLAPHEQTEEGDPDSHSSSWPTGTPACLMMNPHPQQNLVLAPGAFCDQTLKPKLQQLLAKKTPRNKCYEPEETNVVVSVTDRAQRDLTKRFDELDIDWGVVENQLVAWGHLLLDGRQLRIEVSFIYKETTQQVAVRTQQTTRRGGVTATQLAERAELLEDQEAAGLTTVWKEVYSLMRCTGPPCQGTYCWRDPDNRKHYKLETSVLTQLVDYAEGGNMLRTHGDVPPWIRELIYAKEQQDSERRKRKRQASFSESVPPIHITNVMPVRYNQDSVGWSNGSTPETRDSTRIWHVPKLDVPPPIDQSLYRYCEWLCVRVVDPSWKDGYRDACRIALEDGLDLERLYFAQDVEASSLAEKGIKRGIAIQVVSRVKAWLDDM